MKHCIQISIALLMMTGTALAQDGEAPPAMPPMPMPDGMAQPPPAEKPAPTEEEKAKAKEPKKGDFDAGVQTRLPNGPDEMGDFKTGNWVAVDAKGQYLVLDSVAVKGNIPIALKKPSQLMDGTDPRAFGGMQITLEAMLPKMDVPMAPKSKDTKIGLTLTGAYMREGAMLLSEKDYPLFVGSFHPGFSGGLTMKTKVSSLLDFSFVPQWVYQGGDAESLSAVQVPISLIVGLGELVKVSTDIGVYTGDDYTLRSSKGGRVSLGAALDVKVWRLILHGGAGVASLGTGESSAYPTIKDSVYIDLNVKFAK